MSDNENQCDCPICPLLNNNVQVCDVLVKVNPKTKQVRAYYDKDENNISEEVAASLCGLVLTTTQKHKLKVGEVADLSANEFQCYIELKRRDLYKICFHAKNEPETVSAETVTEEDPIEVR